MIYGHSGQAATKSPRKIHTIPKWDLLAGSIWHVIKLTWRGKHAKNATKNKIKISTVPLTHGPTPPCNKTHQDDSTTSKNKTALRSSGSSWVSVGACSLSGEHIIPNGGQAGLKFPHTLTLHRLRETQSKSFPNCSDFVKTCTSWNSWCFATELK